MGEYFVGDFDSFEGYSVEIEAIDMDMDIISCFFMQQWIAILPDDEKKPEGNSGEPRTPDAILYEPIVDKKKKEPEPDPDPEPRAEDFYCDD